MTSDEKRMSPEDGGEVAEFIRNVDEGSYECLCGNHVKLNERSFRGYPHEGGLSDKNGKRWWVWATCPRCNYQMSWRSLPYRLRLEPMPEGWKPGAPGWEPGWQARRVSGFLRKE
ncbi:MAG TPA: hypothetical protein VGG32_07030 [Thermoplasmata archaeon]|jgi:hypothetical protein